MSYTEPLFPEGISLGAKGGPGFNTSILTLSSGHERRSQLWEVARHRYDVSHGLKTDEQLYELRSFFFGRRGKARLFRFKDWQDFELPGADGVQTVQMTTDGGTTATFQAKKTYVDPGGNNYTRELFRLVEGSVQVLDNGGATSDCSVNYNTGVITLGTVLRATTGHVITMVAEFHVLCRFDLDVFEPMLNDIDNHSWDAIPIIEDKG